MAKPTFTIESMVASLKEKTGKTLEEWKVIVADSGLDKHGELLKLLKTTHGLTHGFANTIVHLARETHAAALSEHTDLEASWFEGGKEGLRPLYDKLMEIVRGFGEDVSEAPKKTYMSVIRNKQFACIGPGSKTRIDLQIQLKGEAGTDRLLEVKGGMTSHKVKIESLEDIDGEVIAWLEKAYATC